MRKCGILTFTILFLPSMLLAQSGGARPAGSENGTRATIFGGYSYLRNDSNGFNGWEGQGTFNFNRYLGVTADVSGASLTPFSFSGLGFSAGTYQHLNSYLFGPTVTTNLGRSAVFAHALFGEARSSLGAGVDIPIIGGISAGLTSANAFAMAFGSAEQSSVEVAESPKQIEYGRKRQQDGDNKYPAISDQEFCKPVDRYFLRN